MTAGVDVRDPAVVREELSDLVAYLNGLPEEIRQAGAFLSYEQRAAELSRELVLTDMLLKLKLPGAGLARPANYGQIYDSLSRMTTLYRDSAERGKRLGRGVQWAFVAASAASLVSALASATDLVAPFSGVALALGSVYATWLADRTRRQEQAAMRLWALREEMTQSFGLVGQVLRPSEYYSTSARAIETLLDEISAEIAPSRSGPPRSDSKRFKVLFELRYHPQSGSYPNKDVRARLFEELWPEVSHGSIDAFELFHRLRNLDRLLPEERDEALRDALWTWRINPNAENQSRPETDINRP